MPEDSYPEYFIEWDNAVRRGKKPGFYSSDDLLEIIEIYLDENKIDNARQAVDFALALHGADEDLLFDIMMTLDDFEMWNDLLTLSERYREETEEFGEGHKITALVHLGMEAEAFNFLKTLKKKYANDKDALGMVYAAMGEALLDIDLFESCDEVMQEAIVAVDEDEDFLWIRMQCLVALKNIPKLIKVAEKIQKKTPLDGENWQRLGIMFQEAGEMDRAIDAFENSLSLNYETRENLLNLIFAYDENENPAKALERIFEYIETYESDYYMFFTAAKLCAQLEDYAAALDYINQAIVLEPSADDSIYLYKSSFLMHLDEKRKAKLALAEGIKNTEDPYDNLKKELLKLNLQFPEN
jgi:tetratricopeptide (TPR) repeat protein